MGTSRKAKKNSDPPAYMEHFQPSSFYIGPTKLWSKCRTPVIHVFLVCIDTRLTCSIGEEKVFKLIMKVIIVIIANDNHERAKTER